MCTVGVDRTPAPYRSVLHGAGTVVEVHYGDPDDVFMKLDAAPDAADQSAGARLLCAAVSEARTRHTRRLQTSLEPASPTCWTYLETLRALVGEDVRSITLRRAGSSVLVTLDLIPPGPPATAPRPATALTSRPGGRRHAPHRARPALPGRRS